MVEVKIKNNADFIVREANGYRSREGGDITADAANNILSGTIVALVAGEYVPYNPAGVDGSQTAAAVLYETVFADADTPTVRRTFIVRDAELNGHQLVYNGGVEATVDAALADLGLIVRR